ncbi:LacI family DNA-binding transcriptional regulator [Devosia sp. PTR5]|uniref:LacI family DNA-binding transcriptional regulator n=1 Tax=Devosia oryzisoli TaxID=2774138 RepID=A0A927FV72_9HYPH|nr:LacI family DNA-binding transcriptional regulator [Devosia oryzisoli]MBD8065952.1 LacI family DNA-binding transcriptional regulator [Devosia oryzisoli]
MARKPPTIVDVAKRASVSAATVSYVLSGREELSSRIAPDTQERIRTAIAELDYTGRLTRRRSRPEHRPGQPVHQHDLRRPVAR